MKVFNSKLLFLLSMILLTFSLPSCSDDDNNNGNEPENISIIGHWQHVIEVNYVKVGNGLTFENNNTGFLEELSGEIEIDGTFEGDYSIKHFRYKVNPNGKISLTPIDGTAMESLEIEFKNNRIYVPFTVEYEDGIIEKDTMEFTRTDKTLAETLNILL